MADKPGEERGTGRQEQILRLPVRNRTGFFMNERWAVWGVSGWRKNNKIDRKTDDYVGEEDFVEDNIFGIQELNKVEKALTATSAIIYWKKMSASGLIMIISFCE